MQDQEQKIASISQELALSQLNTLKTLGEVQEKLKRCDLVYQAQGDLEKMILALEDRVKILEEARLRQISLNSTFAVKTTNSIVKKPFWSFLK